MQNASDSPVGLSLDNLQKDFISITDGTGISTSEYGVLVGFGFTIANIISIVILARATDVYNRKLILFYGIIIWSVATACLGLSNNFVELLLSRILLGIGDSSAVPASFSLIADYFPVESLAQANGIYVGGVFVGGGLSSLSIVMADDVGWRWTAYSVAAFGFLLALLVFFTVKESVRASAATLTATTVSGQGTRDPDPEGDRYFTIKQSLALLFGKPLFVVMTIAGILRAMGGYIFVSYLPNFYSQVYPDYNTAYSYLNASVVVMGGALSSYLGGYAADRWEKAGEKRARLYVSAIGTLLGAPAFFMVIIVQNFYASMFFLFVENLLSECWYGPVLSVLQKFLPPRMRGMGFGCYTFCLKVTGSSMTYAVGVILDTYTSDTALKITLIVSVCGMYLASGITHLIASRFMPELNSGPFKGSESEPLLSKGGGGQQRGQFTTEKQRRGAQQEQCSG